MVAVPSNLRFLNGRSASGFSSSLDSSPSSSSACASTFLPPIPGFGFPFAFFAAPLRFCRFARFFAVFASASSSRLRLRCSNSAASTSYRLANHISACIYGHAYSTVGPSTHLLGLLIHQLQALILASSIRLVHVKLATTSTRRASLHVLHHLSRRSDGFFFRR